MSNLNIVFANLPFDSNALEPYISSRTLDFHYGKHHKTYLDNMNKIISENQKYQNLSLESIIKLSFLNNDIALFNNAAQVWNHEFYWKSIKKDSKMSDSIKKLIEENFISVESFKTQLHQVGLSQFGSGWCWLLLDKETNKLTIIKTSNAETPLTNDKYKILLTIDVWEHAYYLDYQNKRTEYLKIFIDHLINWEFVENNYNSK